MPTYKLHGFAPLSKCHYRDIEKCWRLPIEVRHHQMTVRYGWAWMPKYKRSD